MPYVKEKFFIKKPTLAFSFLMSEFGLSMKEAQRWVDRYRLFQDDVCIREKNAKLSGEVEVVIYAPSSRGLKPSFEEEDFVIYDKPSGILVHPTSRDCEYCLYDEILSDYGKTAHIVHRLDKQTSGLIMVAKNKKVEAELKMLFEKRQVQKSYIALVRGIISETIIVDAPLKLNDNYEDIKVRMLVDEDGKESITKFEPIKYFEDINATLVRAFPKTGRQHQIRVHLFHVKHPILGDNLYGVSTDIAKDYLDGNLNKQECFLELGATRLLLHAQSLEFEYRGKGYMFESKKNIEKEFYEFAKGKM